MRTLKAPLSTAIVGVLVLLIGAVGAWFGWGHQLLGTRIPGASCLGRASMCARVALHMAPSEYLLAIARDTMCRVGDRRTVDTTRPSSNEAESQRWQNVRETLRLVQTLTERLSPESRAQVLHGVENMFLDPVFSLQARYLLGDIWYKEFSLDVLRRAFLSPNTGLHGVGAFAIIFKRHEEGTISDQFVVHLIEEAMGTSKTPQVQIDALVLCLWVNVEQEVVARQRHALEQMMKSENPYLSKAAQECLERAMGRIERPDG